MTKKNIVLEVKGLRHRFPHPAGGEDIVLFDNLDLTVGAGDSIALLGSSGSGKSSLLHILGLMANHQQGIIKFDGHSVKQLSEQQKNNLRGHHIGFVFQHHYLVDELTARDNIALPLMLLRLPRAEAKARATTMLGRVGLTARANHYPSDLSGGERQRVALARALVHAPMLLLADEPTGNLDPRNADIVFDMMLAEIKVRNMTAIIATHDWERAKKFQKQYIIKNKKLQG